MLKQSELISLSKSDTVNHFLLVKRSELRLTKSGKEFLTLEVGDKSLSVTANIWDDYQSFATIKNLINSGSIIKIKGSMDDYQGSPQIKVDSVRLLKDSEDVDPSYFLPVSSRNLEEMISEFNSRIELVGNQLIKTLLTNIFTEERFKKYSSAPAGKMWHHGYISGLLEHTLEIIKICDLMCDIHPEINRNLLIAGAMLHDFGKIEELSFESAFEYTDKGKLLGHIVIAAMIVGKEMDLINNFPEDYRNNILHLILSHQGKLEYASPVVPKTLEAITLYQADELSAKVNAYKNTIASEIKNDSQWTRFIHLAGTDLHNHGIDNQSSKENKTLFD